MADNQKRDLNLFENEYALVQDTTRGAVKEYTGPQTVSLQATEVPVSFTEGIGFQVCDIDQAKKKIVEVKEGSYVILKNPAKLSEKATVEEKLRYGQPARGVQTFAFELDMGRDVVIPGPVEFPLWPRQVAEVVQGHHLRSNQFLLVRVYNEEEARKHWNDAIVKTVKTGVESESAQPPADLTVGKLLLIKGTEVSFYIPPTGILVVKDQENGGAYVRDALTLERLEYAILIDESGEKRYEKGPNVVFPEPTERFMVAKADVDDERKGLTKKFRAIELNPLQGIHMKVIAPFKDEAGEHKLGDELFIKGDTTQIFYPREELSNIKYDGKSKHFATAIPAGEARYVMNRMTGEISKVSGPAMLLPDPRTEVIVRRILSDKQCELWYPGNTEALEYNRSVRAVLARLPTTRGAPSEGDLLRSTKGGRMTLGTPSEMRRDVAFASVANNMVMGDSSKVSGDQDVVGEEFVRASNYQQPRTVTLNTKFEGVPVVVVFTGYAVMVVKKNGNRRVEVGPKAVQLDYDESLEVIEMSTGKPKNTDNLYKTVYLRVSNNQVADVLKGETKDHVNVEMRVSYRVNFEGDPIKWFSTENYVKYLCDHVRSVVKGKIKKLTIEEFYSNSTDLLRGMILTPGDPQLPTVGGMFFGENGMRVTDVEVLGVTIQDERIRGLLDTYQVKAVETNIEVATLQRNLTVLKQREAVAREEVLTKFETTKVRNELAIAESASALAVTLMKIGNELQSIQAQEKNAQAKEDMDSFLFDAVLDRDKKRADLEHSNAQIEQDRRIAYLVKEAETVTQKLSAFGGSFSQALLSLSEHKTMVEVSQAFSIQRVLGGDSLSSAVNKVFEGTPLMPMITKLTGAALPNGQPSTQPAARG